MVGGDGLGLSLRVPGPSMSLLKRWFLSQEEA